MEVDYVEAEQLNASGIDIDNAEYIPDIIINSFEAASLPDIQDYRAFFLTKAANKVLWEMKTSEFFNCLQNSSCWKLYISEVMFGLLLLETPSWTKDLEVGNNFLQNLRDEGKIVILAKDVPVFIPLSQVSLTVTNCKKISVTLMRHGRITQMLEFEMQKADGTTTTSCHMGTNIIEDIITGGSYTVSRPHRGFPKVFKEFIQEEEMETESDSSSSNLSLKISPDTAANMTKSFAAVLNTIRRRLRRDDLLQFKIVCYGPDKLVNLWYMKNIAEEFGSSIHVDAKYYNFVKTYLPDFTNYFSTSNSEGWSRFHFNCSNSWGLEFEPCCAPSKEDPADFEVDFVWIGFWVDKLPKNIRIPKSSLCIPYIHEMIYEF